VQVFIFNFHKFEVEIKISLLVVAVVVIGGLIIIPVIEAAEAANAISESRNKGKQGALKGQGRGINI